MAGRIDRVRARMADLGVDALLLSLGADLPWLTGYQAMPLERLTMLVLPADAEATLVVPRLEAPRVEERPALFTLRPWDETEDPVAIVAALLGRRTQIAVSDRTWATFVLALQAALPGAAWSRASAVTGPLRAVKDPGEVEALRRPPPTGWRPNCWRARCRWSGAPRRRSPTTWAGASGPRATRG